MHEDRLEHREDRQPARDVAALQLGLRGGVRRRRDEVAPQLADEERRVQRVGEAQLARGAPVERARLPEDALDAGVVARRVVREAGPADAAHVVRRPARERPRRLADIGLGVRAAIRAEREQLHQLAREVLVGRARVVVLAVEPHEHRGVARHRDQQVAERAEPAAAEQVDVGVDEREVVHELVGDAEPVVPQQRDPFDQRMGGADHPVQPAEVVVLEHVAGGELGVELGVRGRPGERRRPGRAGERRHRAAQAERGERLGVTRARAEPGAPQQPLRLAHAERAGVRQRVVRGRRRRGWRRTASRRGRTAAPAPLAEPALHRAGTADRPAPARLALAPLRLAALVLLRLAHRCPHHRRGHRDTRPPKVST
jgi:hypothetical protein